MIGITGSNVRHGYNNIWNNIHYFTTKAEKVVYNLSKNAKFTYL